MARKLKLKTLLRLKEGDHIRAALPQSAAGPGWANTPLYVLIQDGNGKLREECLQPDEQPRDSLLLYRILEKAQEEMRATLETALIQEAR